jgi:SWI/SNF-related matrix-associated actin-dependent regulator 1 of chromatin subfamily A
MRLEYNAKTGAYFLKVPRSDPANIQSLIREHGFDFSVSASNGQEAVLLTHDPYAAATFGAVATDAAKAALGQILGEINASWKADSQANIACPADRELWPFQRADIEYALRRRNTLIGDQPGLGKTPVAICFANEIKAKRVLVVCPANIRIQWVKRIREWTTMPWPYTVHPILNSKHGVHPTAEWSVVSYDLARTEAIHKALLNGKYDLLILDEAHYLKDIGARRTRTIFGGGVAHHLEPIAERCDRVLALTGTPLPNRPREAYTLARNLCFDAIDWASEDSFRERFNPSMRIERVDPVTGRTKIYIDERSGRHAELQNRLRSHFMVRHLKREVMPQLKLPVYDLIQVEETGAVKQALAAESLLDIDPENLEGADVEVLGHIAVVRRMMGIALAPQVADYVDMLIDGGEEKLVVFAWHIEVLNILEKQLGRHGLIRIDGSTGALKKQRLVDQFRTDPSIQIALGNILSMGTGTDGLQDVSCHGLIAEPSWTPGENIQCFDRLDRGGQGRAVQGDIFVAPNSVAERVLASALRKAQVTHKALDWRIE